MTDTSDSNPRIYVACLAAYNNGYLHGAWIDTDQIRDEIAAMLARSPVEDVEEYAIHDYESFEGVSISEYASIGIVARIAGFIAEYGVLGAGLLEQFSGDIEQATSTLEDCYHGQFASLAEYMEELTTESVTIPEALRYYVYWDAMARDAEMGGDLFTIETAHGEAHVFSNR